MSIDEFDKLNKETQENLKRVAYLSEVSKQYVYPPENDPARFTNHSIDNNLSVAVDEQISTEPYFIANRDIESGEELTNNYFEFDETLKKDRSEWGSANNFL
jgi:hypothetical protein